MNKLLIIAALAVATNVVAQPRPTKGPTQISGSLSQPTQVGMIGNLTTPVIVASSVTAAVAASVIANANGDAKPEVVKTLKCQGTDPLVNNVCVRTTQVTTVTGTGTGTGTKTTTVVVPVTSTYAPTLG